jgi:hypothetical protein
MGGNSIGRFDAVELRMNSLIPSQDRPGTVAIPHGKEIDGISEVISDELIALGYQPAFFKIGSSLPKKAEVVFSFGPYGNFLTIPRQLARMPPKQKPIFVHWNTEGIPDLRIPWKLMSSVSGWRSWLGRLQDSRNGSAKIPGTGWLDSLLETRMLRFRYLGDYYYALRRGWLDIFADTSEIYADLHRQHGLPTIVAHWGATARWYRDLGLERGIDVLWMGTRGTKRRSLILDRVRGELEAHGVRIHVADGQENPFIFGDERIEYLNRSKITLNITRTWYDDNFSRIALAAPNRSLIVSEPVLPHCPSFIAGTHYVSVPVDSLAETILYYLDHEEARLRIVEDAYHLVTTKLVFRESIKSIMDAVNQMYQLIHPVDHSPIFAVRK